MEVYKNVRGYEGHYQVSNFGNVKSLKYGKEKTLIGCEDGGGYLIVGLCKNNKTKTFKVHVLVAMIFLGHKPDGTQKIVVDHIDNNKLNNHADNLQLVTNRENCSKDVKKGSSKFVGVSWDKSSKSWRAHIKFKGRLIHLGCFDLEIDAKNAYDKALEEWEKGLNLNVLYPKGKHKTSQYLGVSWDKQHKKWIATYKRKYIGYFNTELEAHEARENYILKITTQK